MTRQQKWQKKQKARGRCIQCGKPAVTKNHCAVCKKKVTAIQLKRYHKRNSLNIDK